MKKVKQKFFLMIRTEAVQKSLRFRQRLSAYKGIGTAQGNLCVARSRYFVKKI